jgi:molybdopterin-containing oxidoreductase family membrane subunit
MVLLLAIPIRALYGLKDFITDTHLDWMAKILLATGLIVFYGYIMEAFYAWYSGNTYELFQMKYRATGAYAWSYWLLILCNGIIPQLFWSPRMRRSIPVLIFVSIIVSIGMWLERFVIIPVSLTRDYLPASWGYYVPTLFDYSMFLGTVGLFIFLMFLFVRFVPMISAFEMKDLLDKMRNGHGHNGHNGHGTNTDMEVPAGFPQAGAGASNTPGIAENTP